MKMKYLLLLILLLFTAGIFADGSEESLAPRLTISGYIKDAGNGEELPGATVYVKELKTGTTSNVYGFYSLSLHQGKYTIVYSYVGYESQEKTFMVDDTQTYHVELEPMQRTLEEVVVSSTRPDENIVRNEMSSVKLEAKTIQRIPALMGEVDVIKAIQLLPGVQSASEGSSGFSVRGGSPDQNLILLDEATVYNASHLLGFFSVFNNDAVKDVTLHKAISLLHRVAGWLRCWTCG
jgi:hypothetical protein